MALQFTDGSFKALNCYKEENRFWEKDPIASDVFALSLRRR
jgi:hypothetical protein